MKIHPVVSVTNLESVPPGEDPYNQPYDDHPPSVEEDRDVDDEWKSFYIKKLLDHCLCCYGHDKQIIEYLVKWTGYGPEFNEWYEEDFLDSAVKLMLEYEVQQNSDPDRISYLRKLLAVGKTESSAAPANLLPKKQHCKSKQMT